jgi:hypothetical protein
MKKLFLAVAALFIMTFAVQAQHVFDKGSFGLNAGIGIGSYGGYIPSIEVSAEFGVIPTGDVGLVSFGGLVGYKYSTYDYYYVTGDYNYNYNQFEFGGRAAWHLHTFTSDKWDVYAGVGVGLHVDSEYASWDIENDKAVRTSSLGAYEEVFVGGRMMMSSGFGLFAELGYSKLSSARFGLTFMM